MVQFRRNYQPGACYFFTVTLRDRKATYLTDHIHLLRQAMCIIMQKYPYEIKSIVILPDHLHTLWKLPDHDCRYSLRWRKIKSYFTRALKSKGILIPKDRRGEHHLWRRRFWEHTIRDEKDFENHVDYIHYNPVKHALVKKIYQWPYSSFHYCLKKEILMAKKEGMNIEELWRDYYSYGE